MFNTAFDEREGMCIVSDRHDSILKAVALVYPNVAHVYASTIYGTTSRVDLRSIKSI